MITANATKFLVRLMLAIASVGASAYSPAFLWAGRPGMGLVGNTDHLTEVHGAELQQAMAGWASASTAAPLLSGPVQAPEVQVVFLYDQLSTEDVRALGSASFPKLHKLPRSPQAPHSSKEAPQSSKEIKFGKKKRKNMKIMKKT